LDLTGTHIVVPFLFFLGTKRTNNILRMKSGEGARLRTLVILNLAVAESRGGAELGERLVKAFYAGKERSMQGVIVAVQRPDGE
jgi:hypothetical protein